MFHKNEMDITSGAYKCYGDVKHLRFKIRLEIIKSSMIPLSNVEESRSGFDSQYTEREEIELSWNEKVFSPAEFKLYAENRSPKNEFVEEYGEKVEKLITDGTTFLTNRLFSYTFKDTIPTHLFRNMFYSQDYSEVNLDGDSLSNLLHHHNIGSDTFSDSFTLPVRNIVDNNPSDLLRLQNRSLISDCETMYIVADLSEKSRSSDIADSEECFEHLLVTIKWNKRTGTLTVIPDFAPFSTPGYKIEIDALTDTRYVYRYWIVNVSQNEESENIKRIEKLTDEFAAQHKNAAFSMDFEAPFENTQRIFVFAEIRRAAEFSNNNVFIQYLVVLPDGWSAEDSTKLSGITPLSRCKKANDSAAFSYTFELKLSFSDVTNDTGENVNQYTNRRPQFFFEVCSLDGWRRFRVEGYAWTTLPGSSGRYQLILNSWRPAPLSRRDELKRYFIGTDPQILDISFPGCAEVSQNGLLSRYGLETVSSGYIDLELNVVLQRGAAVPRTKKSSFLMDRKTAMLMNSVNHILEAFKKARQRMLLAREPVLLRTE